MAWEATVLWGKGGGSPPAAPDPVATAQAQGAANVETARVQGRMNNPNIYNPLGQQVVTWGEGSSEPTFDEAGYNAAMEQYNNSGGSMQFPDAYRGENAQQVWTPGTPTGQAPDRADFMTQGDMSDQPTIRQTLTPEGQARFDQEQRIVGQLGGMAESGLGRVDEAMSQPLDLSGLPSLDVSDEQRRRVEEALFSRLEPQFQRDEAAMRQRLANQGLTQTHEAYGADVDAFGRQKNDARMQAILAGSQEYQRQFGQNMAARQQGIQERSLLRNQPLQDVNSLRSGGQVPMPQFQPYQGSNVAPPPIAQSVQNAYGQNLAAYNAEQAQQGNFMNGLFSLGGAALMAPTGTFPAMFSDRRLKSNVQRIGTHPLGIGVYSYVIFGEPQIGLMADEVEQVKPEAVSLHPSGFKQVNYASL
jgi:hypothetical protein